MSYEEPDATDAELRQVIERMRKTHAAIGGWRDRLKAMRAKWADEDARKDGAGV